MLPNYDTPMEVLVNFNNGVLKFISINIIAAISWLPPLISQFIHPGHTFFSENAC